MRAFLGKKNKNTFGDLYARAVGIRTYGKEYIRHKIVLSGFSVDTRDLLLSCWKKRKKNRYFPTATAMCSKYMA